MELFYSNSVNSLRALIALEEANVPYDGRLVDLDKGQHHEAWFRSISRFGLVPVLVEIPSSGGDIMSLSQTGAIVLHLAERFPNLLPTSPLERLRATEWCMHAVSDLSPLNALMKYIRRDLKANAEPSHQYMMDRLLRFLDVAERTLHASSSGYLLTEPSIADYSVFPVARHHLATLRASGRFPFLCAWADRIAERSAVQRAVARLTEKPPGVTVHRDAPRTARASNGQERIRQT